MSEKFWTFMTKNSQGVQFLVELQATALQFYKEKTMNIYLQLFEIFRNNYFLENQKLLI